MSRRNLQTERDLIEYLENRISKLESEQAQLRNLFLYSRSFRVGSGVVGAWGAATAGGVSYRFANLIITFDPPFIVTPSIVGIPNRAAMWCAASAGTVTKDGATLFVSTQRTDDIATTIYWVAVA